MPNPNKNELLDLLHIALNLLYEKKLYEFDQLINNIDKSISSTISTKEFNYLIAEYHLLLAWRNLPNLPIMIQHVKIASDLFDGLHSILFTPDFPWGFGVHTQLSLFHYKPGKANEEIDSLTQFIKIYTPLTQGQGTGADILMKAEVAHMRGNFKNAEIFSYHAIFLAKSRNQTIIQLGAAFILAEISILTSNPKMWEQAINFMEQAIASNSKDEFIVLEVEFLRSCLLNELNLPDKIPEWIKKGNLDKNLHPHLYQGFWFIHANYLMHKQEYAKLAGYTNAFLELLSPSDFYISTLFTLLCSLGHLGIGDIKKAESLLLEASERLIPDDFLFLLSVYSWGLKDMPERIIRDKYPNHLKKYLEIKNQFLKGYTTLRQEYVEPLPSDLTPREKEIAILGSRGLRNTEISEKLMITENTVKYHFRNIFQKLNIDRRNKLAEKLNKL